MNEEKKKLLRSIYFPSLFIFIIWIIEIYKLVFDLNLYSFGIFPLRSYGLIGIITAPLIHADFTHLFANTIPLFVLGSSVFYFYRNVAFRLIFLSYLITGILVWIGGRQAYHIGASGFIYALISFIFLSGVIKNDIRLLALSLLVVFLYGGMIWGVLPLDSKISWESHLFGALTGISLAFIYKNEGPIKQEYQWKNHQFEEDENDDSEYNEELPDESIETNITYPLDKQEYNESNQSKTL